MNLYDDISNKETVKFGTIKKIFKIINILIQLIKFYKDYID